MVNNSDGFPRISADKVERLLAILLIGLGGMYGLGTVSGGVVPVLDTIGVISVHLAVVVAGVFPLAVLGHAANSRVRTGSVAPGRLEVVCAVTAFACLLAALWVSMDSVSALGTPLLAIAAGSLLVLVGLVIRR